MPARLRAEAERARRLADLIDKRDPAYDRLLSFAAELEMKAAQIEADQAAAPVPPSDAEL